MFEPQGGWPRRSAGTEGFQDFCLSFNRRADVRALIGERAEFVAYVNCVMDRTTLDAALGAELGERWVQACPEPDVRWLTGVSGSGCVSCL